MEQILPNLRQYHKSNLDFISQQTQKFGIEKNEIQQISKFQFDENRTLVNVMKNNDFDSDSQKINSIADDSDVNF